MEPLPSPGPSPVHSSPPPLLVINSEAFTLWTAHFARLHAMVDLWNDEQTALQARLFTLVRAQHVSFSDFPLFFAFRWIGRGAMRVSDVTFELVSGFLAGELERALSKQRKASGAEEKVGKKRRLVGNAADVVVHA